MRIAVFCPDPILSEAIGCFVSHSAGYDVSACQTHLGHAAEIVESQKIDAFLVTHEFADEASRFTLQKLSESLGIKVILLATEPVPRENVGGFHSIVNSFMGPGAFYSALRRLNEEIEAKKREMNPPKTVRHSAREREAAEYVRRGLSNRDIAKAMQVSEQSVKNYLSSLMRKHGVDNRLQLGLLLAGVIEQPESE
jgi:DNA-binding NarL/FixJ family response regulator